MPKKKSHFRLVPNMKYICVWPYFTHKTTSVCSFNAVLALRSFSNHVQQASFITRYWFCHCCCHHEIKRAQRTSIFTVMCANQNCEYQVNIRNQTHYNSNNFLQPTRGLIPPHSLQLTEVDPRSINKRLKEVSDLEVCSQNNKKAEKKWSVYTVYSGF